VISLNTYSLVINHYLTHSLLITDRVLGQYINILRHTFPKATAVVAISKTKLSPLFAGAARLKSCVCLQENEKFEYSKGVSRSLKSKKDKQNRKMFHIQAKKEKNPKTILTLLLL
jgi:hypothetical protein